MVRCNMRIPVFKWKIVVLIIIDFPYVFWVFYKPGNKDSHTFGWSERYKVAVGVAEALEYLHNASAKPVIHRDVKSSNILLSYDFEPQVIIGIDLAVYTWVFGCLSGEGVLGSLVVVIRGCLAS